MRPRYVHYPLEHGFIHNWLVGGPQAIPIQPRQFQEENLKQQVIQQYYERDSGITKTPVERGPLTKGVFQVGDYSSAWSYLACREDHLVDFSSVYPSGKYLRSWAFSCLESTTAQDVTLKLFVHGPADVWLNDQHVQRHEQFSGQQPGSVSFQVALKPGVNKLLVRFEQVALQECPYALALQVCSPSTLEPYPADTAIRVCIPSLIPALDRRNKFERAAAATYITQDVFEAHEQIRLHWPADLEQSSSATVRLMTPTNRIYAEATVDGTAGDSVFLQTALEVPPGPYRIFMFPLVWEYYEHDLRITREVGIWSLGNNRVSTQPYGTEESRRKEALTSAAQWSGLFAEIARMALGQWEDLETRTILQAAQNPGPQELLGLLGMLYRFGEVNEFPAALRQPLEDAILSYPFGAAPAAEAEQILLYAAEILAGQRYPQTVFSATGKTGEWYRQNGEQLALKWLAQRGATGFSDWDSGPSFAWQLMALSYLVDLAETQAIWELASILMDKLFATIALNSYRGVFGSSQGRTSAPFIKGALLEPTSGLTRLMWGAGIFNQHIAGTVSLACMQQYELPALIPAIATSLPEETWSQERHAVDAAREVNKVTYKTPDGMLSSAQDYCPGQKGRLEHIWQATLSPTATVFVNHPACSSENDACQPNFWAGNGVLPRVAQWKDALVALYQLPADDWMGFTHAYFPTTAFDEYVLRQGWAFARQGDGYLAITAQQPFHLTQRGHYALRELRSYGQNNIWLCQLGRAALDGDFAAFQEKILALKVEYSAGSVRWPTLRGETLSFGWQGPFLKDGQEQPLSGFAHYEGLFASSEFPSREMEIRFGETALRLNFGDPSNPVSE
jgi:hypothetical protein